MSEVIFRLGIDIGGTFTDVLLIGSDGLVVARKVLSTVDDYTRGIVEVLDELATVHNIPLSAIQDVVHGTTVATNAVLERKGACTGLITTKGFRDVLELRRIRLPELYNLFWEKPAPLVPRYLRLEVGERIDYRGQVDTPLDPSEVEAVLQKLVAEGVESLAVCLLNSYANPEHERAIARIASEQYPGLPVSISSSVLGEIKEYERTSTTVVNAYVTPIVAGYVAALEKHLQARGIGAPLLIMQSNGGMMPASTALERPVHLLESGPAAGVMGAVATSRAIGEGNLITFDMGGTTAKAAIVEDGEPSFAHEYEVGAPISIGNRLMKGGGYLLRIPAVDIAEVGAGGGSIISIDPGGSLQVGPRSAGAHPGPACYGGGGVEATITDANLILGYLNPTLLGGEFRLLPERAREAIRAKVAEPLGLELIEAAYGAHVLANAIMIRAIRAVSIERGRDARDFTLVAFGGSGPVHAAGIAAELGIRRILVPPRPGLFSAYGMLAADVQHTFVRTVTCDVSTATVGRLNQVLAELRHEATSLLAQEGYGAASYLLQGYADLRYKGQSFALSIPLADGSRDLGDLATLAERFGREHERTYGHRGGLDEAVQVVNLRLLARVGQATRLTEPPGRDSDQVGEAPGRRVRRAYFGAAGLIEVPLLARRDLATPPAGPVIVEEYDTTIVIPPRCRASLDSHGNVVIEVAATDG